MRECPEAEIRDLLPDLAAGRLAGEARTRTDAHLAGCGDCAAEVALLRRLRASAATPAVNVGAIVRALPRPPHAGAPREAPGVVSLAAHREARERSRAPRFASWRRAAAIASIVLGGAVSFGVLRERSDVVAVVPADPVAPTAPVVPAPGDAPPMAIVPPGGRAVQPAPRVPAEPRAIGLGGVVAELSTEEMESLLAGLEQFDGVTSAEPVVVAPVVEEGTGEA